MLGEYIGALALIFIAEMGDKTQILAMMFATKYKTGKVLLGICIGSFLNHGLAVAFGTILGEFINPNILQVVAGFAFIGFAFWTLLANEDEEEVTKQSSKGAIITVAAAFFIGELGDKTQLTAITLSVDAYYPVIVLMGTVSGMVLTSSIGIFIGSKLGDKIPELMIKLFSGSIFLLFGSMKLIGNTPSNWITLYTIIPFATVILFGIIYVFFLSFKGIKTGELTPLRHAAKLLYELSHQNKNFVDELCMTINHCGKCQGQNCGVGLIRHMLEDISSKDLDNHHEEQIQKIIKDKGKFDQDKLLLMLEMNIKFLINSKIFNIQYEEVNRIRKVIEILLIGEWIEFNGSLDNYLISFEGKNIDIAQELKLHLL